MPDEQLTRVRSTHRDHADNPDHLIFHEHDPRHPGAEVRVYGGEIVEVAETEWLLVAIRDAWLERTEGSAPPLSERIRRYVIWREHRNRAVPFSHLRERYGMEALESVWPIDHLHLAGDGTVLVDHAAVEGRTRPSSSELTPDD